MNRWFAFIAFCAVLVPSVSAQERKEAPAAEKSAEPADAGRMLEAESAVTTTHEVTVNGQRFPYRATAGTQPTKEVGRVVTPKDRLVPSGIVTQVLHQESSGFV